MFYAVFLYKSLFKIIIFTIVVDNVDKYARFFIHSSKLHKYILTKN